MDLCPNEERAVPSIAAAHVRSLVEALARMDVDPGRLLAEANLTATLSDPDLERVPIEAHLALWSAARRLTADDHLGLHVGERVTFGRWGVVEQLVFSAETLRQATARAIRYWELVSTDGKLITLRESKDDAILSFGSPLCDDPDALDADAVYTLRLIRQALDPTLALRAAHLVGHPRGAAAEYQRVLGVAPSFGAEAQTLSFPREILDRPILGASAPASAWAAQHADAELSRLSGALASEARRAIASDLPRASLAHVAALLGTSERSLQRRLADEGVTFRKLLDETRRSVALSLLAIPDLPLAEIGRRLGFSDPSAFSHAARRWFEEPPSERRQRRA